MSSTQLMDVDFSSRSQTASPDQDPESEPEAKWFDLMPNRQLLDANFEGYKLSLDSFAQYKIELGQDGRQVSSRHSASGGDHAQHKITVYQHLKLLSLQNLLFVNPHADSLAYYFDSKLRLNRVNYCLPGLLPARQLVSTNFQIAEADDLDRVDVTMRFVSETRAVVYDGYDSLYVIEQASRKSLDDVAPENWTVLFKWKASSEAKCLSSVVKDALAYENRLHVLLVNVHEAVSSDSDSSSKFETYVHWLTIERSGDDSSWALARVRRINCQNHVPEYVSLETSGRAINITGPKFIRFDFDSATGGEIKPRAKVSEAAARMETRASDQEPLYAWSQTAEEIVVKMRGTGRKIDKTDLKVAIQPTRLQVRFAEDVAVFDGELFSAIKPDESTWTLNENTAVEFTLTKASAVTWTSLLKVDDKRGEYTVSDDASAVNLAFTSDLQVKAAENKPLFSLEQQLEECDGLVDDQAMGNADDDKLIMIRRIDGETHVDSHQSYINDNKVLFDVRASPSKCPALCLRHDVDGVLWQPHRVSAPSPSETIWLSHEHTFKAFGYVQASKLESKFCLSPPDMSYVCVCDTQKHVYVYKQTADVLDANLRNRKTGQAVKHVAKQYLISLDTDKEILGFYCANQHILVLTAEAFYIYKTTN